MHSRIAGSLIVCALVSGCSIRGRFSIEPADAAADVSAADAVPVPDAAADSASLPDVTDDGASTDVVGDVAPDVSCPAGQSACGGRCVDTLSDPMNCGACGTVCPSGNARVSFACVTGRCVGECSTGVFVPDALGGSCASVARQIAPISGSFVQGGSIELRFTIIPNDMHELQLCSDPGCLTGVRTTLAIPRDATSHVVTLSAAELSMFDRGFVYWRLLSESYTSPTWSVRVLADPTITPGIAAAMRRRRLAFGANTDFTGDGTADIVMSAVDGTRRKLLLMTRPPTPMMPATFEGPYDVPLPHAIGPSSVIARVGDINGDGRSDIAVSAERHTGVFVFRGSPGGFDPNPLVIAAPAGSATFGSNIVGGDLDGDGYGDLIVADDTVNSQTGRVHVYWGSAFGPSASRLTEIVPTDAPPSGGRFGAGLESACDLNGDGKQELLVGAPHPSGTAPAAYLYEATNVSGTRSITMPVRLPPSGETGFGAQIVCLGDIDNDGDHEWGTATVSSSLAGQIALYQGVESSTPINRMTRNSMLTIGAARVSRFLPAYDMLRTAPGQGMMDLVFVASTMSPTSFAIHTLLNNNAASFNGVLGPIDVSSVLPAATRINATVLHSASGEPQLFFIAPGALASRFGVGGTIPTGDFAQPTVASVMDLLGVPMGLTNVGEVLMR
jgi:hypothetical protein